ncbi:hypothetical protein CDL12_14938 [Handroanthus impetiginosus]|uniref:Uncharacterized protein n=1 Tax=Handroanthus impetiginosus TaxID=429701 RepID=A0A2G9H571_9LAMI|nr:hypothetical protein CDL12_14938 [Handroanthus impetiginosus]
MLRHAFLCVCNFACSFWILLNSLGFMAVVDTKFQFGVARFSNVAQHRLEPLRLRNLVAVVVGSFRNRCRETKNCNFTFFSPVIKAIVENFKQ